MSQVSNVLLTLSNKYYVNVNVYDGVSTFTIPDILANSYVRLKVCKVKFTKLDRESGSEFKDWFYWEDERSVGDKSVQETHFNKLMEIMQYRRSGEYIFHGFSLTISSFNTLQNIEILLVSKEALTHSDNETLKTILNEACEKLHKISPFSAEFHAYKRSTWPDENIKLESGKDLVISFASFASRLSFFAFDEGRYSFIMGDMKTGKLQVNNTLHNKLFDPLKAAEEVFRVKTANPLFFGCLRGLYSRENVVAGELKRIDLFGVVGNFFLRLRSLLRLQKNYEVKLFTVRVNFDDIMPGTVDLLANINLLGLEYSTCRSTMDTYAKADDVSNANVMITLNAITSSLLLRFLNYEFEKVLYCGPWDYVRRDSLNDYTYFCVPTLDKTWRLDVSCNDGASSDYRKANGRLFLELAVEHDSSYIEGYADYRA